MSLFARPEVTILKESSDAKEYLSKLEELYIVTVYSKKSLILTNQEILNRQLQYIICPYEILMDIRRPLMSLRSSLRRNQLLLIPGIRAILTGRNADLEPQK